MHYEIAHHRVRMLKGKSGWKNPYSLLMGVQTNTAIIETILDDSSQKTVIVKAWLALSLAY